MIAPSFSRPVWVTGASAVSAFLPWAVPSSRAITLQLLGFIAVGMCIACCISSKVEKCTLYEIASPTGDYFGSRLVITQRKSDYILPTKLRICSFGCSRCHF